MPFCRFSAPQIGPSCAFTLRTENRSLSTTVAICIESDERPWTLREALPPERVDETINNDIHDDVIDRLGLTPTGDFDVIQHIELPETPVHVTEYRLAVYQDADGQLYIPECPELNGPIFGPRPLATIGWLKSMGHCSYSTIEAWMEDVLQVPVSRGYLAKLCTGTIRFFTLS